MLKTTVDDVLWIKFNPLERFTWIKMDEHACFKNIPSHVQWWNHEEMVASDFKRLVRNKQVSCWKVIIWPTQRMQSWSANFPTLPWSCMVWYPQHGSPVMTPNQPLGQNPRCVEFFAPSPILQSSQSEGIGSCTLDFVGPRPVTFHYPQDPCKPRIIYTYLRLVDFSGIHIPYMDPVGYILISL